MADKQVLEMLRFISMKSEMLQNNYRDGKITREQLQSGLRQIIGKANDCVYLTQGVF